MWLWNLLRGRDQGRGVEELARRLELEPAQLHSVRPSYREFHIPKRSGGRRRILAPEPELKALQRRILKRLLGRLRSHPAVHGFERGRSIATNARCHVGKAAVVRMDLKDFFERTRAERVRDYFRTLGWNREASNLLVTLCTREGGLPQGAPTSPRLSNLVNFGLDARLAGLAQRFHATYTRYADDLTFSFGAEERINFGGLVDLVAQIVSREGYTLHVRKKLHVRRSHHQQLVTGLVVNEQVDLPRARRRWLRAVEHRLRTGRAASLTPSQLDGWRAFETMIIAQAHS